MRSEPGATEAAATVTRSIADRLEHNPSGLYARWRLGVDIEPLRQYWSELQTAGREEPVPDSPLPNVTGLLTFSTASLAPRLGTRGIRPECGPVSLRNGVRYRPEYATGNSLSRHTCSGAAR